jgi:MoxR-like ATPase
MNSDLIHFLNSADHFLPGNSLQIRLTLLALILNRNILIEDVPGMGKTTLVKFFAKASGLDFKRIQFTSDLLPSDVLGVSLFNKETEKFIFRPGPVFAELILADELNRASPKTQSALLQAMEEKLVTVDGETFNLPARFCLIATQNPRGQFGTYPLPESQLDRFLFKISMGHLNREEEISLLSSGSRLTQVDQLPVIFEKSMLDIWQNQINKIEASPVLLSYIADLLAETRKLEGQSGLSPRAGLDLLSATKGWAWLNNRTFSIPDDVQYIFPYVAGHRIFSHQSLSTSQENSRCQEILRKVNFIKK